MDGQNALAEGRWTVFFFLYCLFTRRARPVCHKLEKKDRNSDGVKEGESCRICRAKFMLMQTAE